MGLFDAVVIGLYLALVWSVVASVVLVDRLADGLLKRWVLKFLDYVTGYSDHLEAGE